jgi:hypothetical protein
MQIFDLSGITNVSHCYQQTKFSKYLTQRIIGVQNNDIRPFVHTNTENTILHTNQSFDTLKQKCINLSVVSDILEGIAAKFIIGVFIGFM